MTTAFATQRPRVCVRITHAQFLEYGFVATVCALRVASEPTGSLSYLLIAGYAVGGRAQVIKALALSWLFTMMNPGFTPDASAATVGRFLVIGAAAGSVFLRSRFILRGQGLNKLVTGTVLLGSFFVMHSVFVSPFPAVSILKAVAWTVAMIALLDAWLGLSRAGRNKLSREIFGGLVLVMLFSLPLLDHPLGYLRNGRGFQGVLNQPQVFGSTIAILGAWATSQLVGERRPRSAMGILVAACLVLVFLSQARTAGLALVLGVGIAFIAVPTLSGRRIAAVVPGLKSRRFWMIVAVVLLGSILLGPNIAKRVGSFMAKGTAANTLSGAYYRSRGSLIGPMWANTKKHPLEGIGFGVASDPSTMNIKRDPVLGLPVGASIEKGVMPLAVLEEVGLGGWLAVAVWVLILLRRAARESISCLAVLCTVLLLNMGESTLFSPGGFGMLNLIMLAWAATGVKGRRSTTA